VRQVLMIVSVFFSPAPKRTDGATESLRLFTAL